MKIIIAVMALLLSLLAIDCHNMDKIFEQNSNYVRVMFPDCMYFVNKEMSLYVVSCKNRTIECYTNINYQIQHCDVVKEFK